MQCANQFSHKTTTAASKFPFFKTTTSIRRNVKICFLSPKKQNNLRLGSWLGHVTVAVNLPSQQAATAAAASATEAHVYSLGIGIKRTLHFSQHSNVIIHQKGHSFWFYLKNYTKCCVFFSVHTIYRSHTCRFFTAYNTTGRKLTDPLLCHYPTLHCRSFMQQFISGQRLRGLMRCARGQQLAVYNNPRTHGGCRRTNSHGRQVPGNYWGCASERVRGSTTTKVWLKTSVS